MSRQRTRKTFHDRFLPKADAGFIMQPAAAYGYREACLAARVDLDEELIQALDRFV